MKRLSGDFWRGVSAAVFVYACVELAGLFLGDWRGRLLGAIVGILLITLLLRARVFRRKGD